MPFNSCFLTHWGRATHICVSKLTIIGSDNGLSPGRHQAIIWTNYGILLIGPLGSKIHTFSFNKIHLKTSSPKWRPFCLGLNVLTISTTVIVINMLLSIYWQQDKISLGKTHLKIPSANDGDSEISILNGHMVIFFPLFILLLVNLSFIIYLIYRKLYFTFTLRHISAFLYAWPLLRWLPARWAPGFSGDHQQMQPCLCRSIFNIVIHVCCNTLFALCWQ